MRRDLRSCGHCLMHLYPQNHQDPGSCTSNYRQDRENLQSAPVAAETGEEFCFSPKPSNATETDYESHEKHPLDVIHLPFPLFLRQVRQSGHCWNSLHTLMLAHRTTPLSAATAAIPASVTATMDSLIPALVNLHVRYAPAAMSSGKASSI